MASAHDAPPGDTVKVAPTGGSTQSLDGVSPARQPPSRAPPPPRLPRSRALTRTPALACCPRPPPPLRAQGYTLKLGTDKIIGNGSFVSPSKRQRASAERAARQ